MIHKLKDSQEFRTAVKLLAPTAPETVLGVARAQSYQDKGVIYCTWKSYGGTEQNVNGVYSIIDTATVTTWYRPDITSGCRLQREDGAFYEIINEPENLELQNTFLQFKVRRVKGGA